MSHNFFINSHNFFPINISKNTFMYTYRKLTEELQKDIVKQRQLLRRPWHAPPHFNDGEKLYLITAANYEPRALMNTNSRLNEFYQILVLNLSRQTWASIHAWVILPNHYHILAKFDLGLFRKWIHKIHNKTSTKWNREDQKYKRKVWFRFSDRAIRGERHYYTTLNYIHSNPVKHNHVRKADEWKWSSVHYYLEEYGRESLISWWRKCSIANYGMGWDD